MKKYFEVQAMCGHVGKGKYIPISFPVIAINGKEAAEKVRSYPRVKHHYKKAILNVWEISFDSYLKLKMLIISMHISIATTYNNNGKSKILNLVFIICPFLSKRNIKEQKNT